MFRAVDGISFTVNRGESVGLVGESGCGKSTTSTMVMRLIDKTDGTIMFDGEDIGEIPAKQFAKLPLRKRIQMVFQDPTDSLNPRFTAARAIADPILRLGDVRGRDAVRARCEELAQQVGLPLDLLDRFPHQLSGGQKARVGIARAIALKPDLVILDEPTAALDVSVQAVVLNLLQDLKESLGMSYLFVSHDLNVVRLLCDRVIVMQAGKIVEEGPTERVLFAPEAQYTRDLLAAIPHPTFEPEHADPAGWRPAHDATSAQSASRAQGSAQASRKGRKVAKPAKPQPDPLDDFIAAGARALELTIDKPGCRRCAAICRSRCGTARWSRTSRCRTTPSRRRCSRPEAAAMDWASAAEIARAVADGERSALAVTEAALARIASLNPQLNAFTDVIAERARAQGARRSIAARGEGEPLGPLAGVPFAVKNLFDVAGLPTLAGSKINRDHAAGRARRDPDRAAGGGRRRAGRRAQHGRIRLRLHRRERPRRRLAQSARSRRA